jgi:hypothetical protein
LFFGGKKVAYKLAFALFGIVAVGLLSLLFI